MEFTRFVALGDSITEGLSDERIAGQYRGWADRVADVLSQSVPDFSYANLAVRGKKLEQVVAQQVPVALPLIEGPQTLVSFHAGANNALRPGYDAAAAHALYREAVRTLAETGATLLLFTVQEVREPRTRAQRMWNKRFCAINDNARATAAEVGAMLMDGNDVDVFYDSRLLAADRLHLNAEGHRRVAAAVLERLGLPHDSDWREPLPLLHPRPAPLRWAGTAAWALVFLGPWLLRRLTGRSSGDGRVAKYVAPIRWPR